jgi:hypothetical protein
MSGSDGVCVCVCMCVGVREGQGDAQPNAVPLPARRHGCQSLPILIWRGAGSGEEERHIVQPEEADEVLEWQQHVWQGWPQLQMCVCECVYAYVSVCLGRERERARDRERHTQREKRGEGEGYAQPHVVPSLLMDLSLWLAFPTAVGLVHVMATDCSTYQLGRPGMDNSVGL